LPNSRGALRGMPRPFAGNISATANAAAAIGMPAIANTPGRSLYVRLAGARAGRWNDATTGEHGDLLDLIALVRHLPTLKLTIAEARRFLDLPAESPRQNATPLRRDATRAA
jgi:hypothetical protein